MLMDSDRCIRYYHQNDIPTVLQTLHSSVQHNTMYAQLCKAIQQYWGIPMEFLSVTEMPTNLASKTEDGECLASSFALLDKKSYDIAQHTENEKVASSITDFSSTNLVELLEKSKCTKEQACTLPNLQLDRSIVFIPSAVGKLFRWVVGFFAVNPTNLILYLFFISYIHLPQSRPSSNCQKVYVKKHKNNIGKHIIRLGMGVFIMLAQKYVLSSTK